MSKTTKAQRMEAHLRAKSLEFLRNPDRWPLWPRLPLKRGEQNSELGVLFAQDETDLPIRVWRCSLYDRIDPKTTPSYEYISFEELLDEGKWRVD